jgi:hypothetical protein
MNAINDTLATMLTVTQLPLHLQGELYKNILDEYGEDEETFIGRPIKTDFIFDTHEDILHMIDTCMFLAVDLPDELFNYVALNKSVFYQMREYELDVHRGTIEESFFVTTAEYRALKVLAEFETSIRFAVPYNLAAYAIENNSLVLLQYIGKRYAEHLDPYIIHFAVEFGNIQCIDYLVEHPKIKPLIFKITNHVSGKTLAQQLCGEAHTLPVLKHLHETLRFPWDENVIKRALSNKCNECLQYALANGCQISLESATGMALRHPTIDAFRILVEVAGYNPLQEDTLYAASRGSLPHLTYLHELGVAWHPQAVNSAARFKHHTCVEYGIEHGAPYDANLVELSRLPYRADIDRWMASIIYNE